VPGFEVIGEEERAAVNELFDDGGILFRHGFDALRKGRYRVLEFERAFADWLGVGHALAVSSGSAAVKVALVGLGIQPGDEVITQAFTFVATVEAIVDIGATPVIVNVDDTLNMDPAELEAAITPRTRAVVPVHMLGVAAELERIAQIARVHDLLLLDDNCESLGAEWNGAKIGGTGDAGAFSLDFGKVITSGEGGVVATNDEEVYKLAREYHDHGHEDNPSLPRGRDTHRIHGFNYRLTEIQAAIAGAQLAKLDDLVAANRRNYARLEAVLQGIDGLVLRRVPEACTPLCDTLIFELPDVERATTFVARMGERGLSTKNLPDAIEWHFAGYWSHIFGRFGLSADELWRQTLPSWQRLSRCIAVPVMVRDTPERVDEVGGMLREIAAGVLE
jgi:8-amino-3,8-dideoxy-alpha-D-manno-octulosonate transaminase